MYLIIPGRHHLLTAFQFNYLHTLIHAGLKNAIDVNGHKTNLTQPVEAIVFTVTSANHFGTKRNPLPFYLRAMMIQEFCRDLPIPCYVFGIDDVGIMDNFALYTIKQIDHQSDHRLEITPQNAVVVCSTQVMEMYESLGYTILPAELSDRKKQTFHTDLPWDLTLKIGTSECWYEDAELLPKLHPASFKIWKTYRLGKKVKTIFQDPIIGTDGDLTESRDYNTYVRQMDEIAELKYNDTAAHIVPGKIGDIGCAVGSWIKLSSEDARLRESDFYGIEVARQLFSICNQRKENGEFGNPNVFFSQKNAVTTLVFEPESMNTIHTSSLTHEIESYGSREDLLTFIQNRYHELAPGGVWINRDVIGPENGHKRVYMLLSKTDGKEAEDQSALGDSEALKNQLDPLSTFGRFKQFLKDYRKKENDQIVCDFETIQNREYAVLPLKDAAEYMLTKDYTDNWESEMHERFCFWSFSDWKEALEAVGFQLEASSHAYTNPWIRENRFENQVMLFEKEGDALKEISYPPTNALLVARKI